MSEADRTPTLDRDIVDALGEALRPSEMEDKAVLQRVRSRLMKRIADDSVGQHLTVPSGADGWQRLLPGIQRKVLHQDAEVMSYLLKFAPGAVLPAHRHPMDEECVVLEGTLRIGDMVLAT